MVFSDLCFGTFDGEALRNDLGDRLSSNSMRQRKGRTVSRGDVLSAVAVGLATRTEPRGQKDPAGHGPSFSLTHRVAGKTVTQVVPQGLAVERAKAKIAEYHRFRKLVRELIVVSEQICSAQVRDSEALPASEAKKKPLRPSIRQRRRSGDWRQAVEDLDLERTAEALGKEIAEDERHCTEPCDVLALPRTLYRGMDGT